MPRMGLLFLLFLGGCAWVALITLGVIHRLTHPARLTYGVAVARQWPTSPTDLGLAFEEQAITFPDGTMTPAFVVTGHQPEGPAVILSHGWGHSRYGLLPWMQTFAPHASRVIAYDLRGQGESTAAASRLGTAEVDDLLHVIRQLTSPGEKIVLAGQSMGGGISIVAAAKASVEVSISAVVVDGGYRLGMQPVVGYFRKRQWPIWPFWLFVAGHLAFWYSSPQKFDRAKYARQLRCPLLLLHGRQDLVCPWQAAADIAHAAGQRATLVTFDPGGHLDLQQLDPQRYNNALATFFQQLETTSPSPQPTPQESTT